jgi:hypothetical protein
MDTCARVEVSCCVGDLRRIRIARRNEAVDEWCGWVTEDLLRTGLRGRLGEVMILHRNHEDISDSLRRACRRCLRGEQNPRRDASEQCCPAPDVSEQKTGKSRCVVWMIVMVWRVDI